jgi:hypothetical protein
VKRIIIDAFIHPWGKNEKKDGRSEERRKELRDGRRIERNNRKKAE